MLFICDFEFWGVDERVVGSQEGEAESEEEREANRCGQTSVDGALRELNTS